MPPIKLKTKSDRVLLAERKNRLEKVTLDKRTCLLDKESERLSNLVDKDKKRVQQTLVPLQRTTGYSDDAVAPSVHDAEDVRDSVVYRSGVRLSEKQLNKWKGTEKALIKQQVVQPESEDDTDSDSDIDLETFIKMQGGVPLPKDAEDDESKDIATSFNPEASRPNSAKGKIDVFQALKQELTNKEQIKTPAKSKSTSSIYSSVSNLSHVSVQSDNVFEDEKPHVTLQKNPPGFCITAWADETLKSYAQGVTSNRPRVRRRSHRSRTRATKSASDLQRMWLVKCGRQSNQTGSESENSSRPRIRSAVLIRRPQTSNGLAGTIRSHSAVQLIRVVPLSTVVKQQKEAPNAGTASTASEDETEEDNSYDQYNRRPNSSMSNTTVSSADRSLEQSNQNQRTQHKQRKVICIRSPHVLLLENQQRKALPETALSGPDHDMTSLTSSSCSASPRSTSEASEFSGRVSQNSQVSRKKSSCVEPQAAVKKTSFILDSETRTLQHQQRLSSSSLGNNNRKLSTSSENQDVSSSFSNAGSTFPKSSLTEGQQEKANRPSLTLQLSESRNRRVSFAGFSASARPTRKVSEGRPKLGSINETPTSPQSAPSQAAIPRWKRDLMREAPTQAPKVSSFKAIASIVLAMSRSRRQQQLEEMVQEEQSSEDKIKEINAQRKESLHRRMNRFVTALQISDSRSQPSLDNTL